MRRLMVMCLLLAAVAAAAQEPDLELPPGRWWENQRLAERLSLTDQQRDEIRDLVYEHAHRMIDLTAAVRRSELELAQVVEPPSFEAAAARKAFASLQDARRALEQERFEMLLAVRGVLTSDQWAEVQRLRRELRRDRPPLEGPGGRRPPPSGPGR